VTTIVAKRLTSKRIAFDVLEDVLVAEVAEVSAAADPDGTEVSWPFIPGVEVVEARGLDVTEAVAEAGEAVDTKVETVRDVDVAVDETEVAILAAKPMRFWSTSNTV